MPGPPRVTLAAALALAAVAPFAAARMGQNGAEETETMTEGTASPSPAAATLQPCCTCLDRDCCTCRTLPLLEVF